MGCGSTNEIKNKPMEIKDEINNKPVKMKDEIKPKPVEIKDEITEPGNYYYCLNEKEISYIEELKEKKDQDIKNGKEKGGDKFYPLFRRIELDFTTTETIIKEYLVFYIPRNYSKSTLIYQGTLPISDMTKNILEKNPNRYPK